MTGKISLPVAALLAMMLCCAAAAQNTWFDVNFDNYNLGDINGQQEWTGAAGPVRIVSNFDGAGRCVGLDCLNFAPSGEVSRSVSSGGSGMHYAEFRVAMDCELKPGQVHYNLCYLRFFSTTGTELTRFYFRGDRFNILLAPAEQRTILLDESGRQWHKIGLLFNLLTRKLDVFVDDSQVVTQGDLYGAGTDIGRIAIGQWDQVARYDKAECYVDNFLCSSQNPSGVGRIELAPRFFPGWQAYNVCYPCVFRDNTDNKLRMFYSGAGMGYVNESTWDQWTTGFVKYVTSVNGTGKWIFPDSYEAVLHARKFMEGELVLPQVETTRFDSIFAYMPCVIQEGSTYKMWYAGWNGDSEERADHTANKINFRIGYATSLDGVTWTKHPNNENPAPVLNIGACGVQDSYGVSHPWVLKKNGTYHMWYEGYDRNVWRIFHTTSADGINWQTPQMVLSPGASGAPDGLNARNPVVVEKSGVYEMWYQGESSTSPKYHVLRATSADGITWSKVPGEVVLHPPVPPPGWYGALDPNDPASQVLVNTVIPEPDGTYTVYYARQMTETRWFVNGTRTAKTRYFFILQEVVDL